ncbi:MAG: DegV family protein [Polyangia bacterium]
MSLIVVASAGLNLPRELLAHCQIEETPQKIVVDGTYYDFREIGSYAAFKAVVEQARTPPHGLGSSAAEYVAVLNELVKRTDRILIVTGTRKLLGTYDAAVVATRILGSTHKHVEVRVFDTALVELGAGLIAAYCGAAARARPDLDPGALARAGEALARASMQLYLPSEGSLSRSGRFDLARSLWQSVPDGTPVIGMKDGELRNVAVTASRAEAADKALELLQRRYEPNTSLWLTVSYGDETAPAHALLARLRRLFDVRYVLLRRLNPMAYLLLGPSAICITAHPTSAMKLSVKLPEV